MEKLSTIQKRSSLNEVYPLGEKANGGAYHNYEIRYDLYPVGEAKQTHITSVIEFQKGPRLEADSTAGIIDTDLLEIVRHRLQCFQEGGLKTRENAIALTHIEEALLWMNKRVEDRIERNILGTMEK